MFRPLDQVIHAVKGTDGLIHLSYAVQVTNATAENGTKFRAEASWGCLMVGGAQRCVKHT